MMTLESFIGIQQPAISGSILEVVVREEEKTASAGITNISRNDSIF